MPLRTRKAHAFPVDQERRAEDRPAIYETGRICAVRGCPTILHRYHKGGRCYVHEPPRSTIIRTLDEYVALMEEAA